MPDPTITETATTTEQRDAIYCRVCGTPWWPDHTAACSRHAYRPAHATPPEADEAPLSTPAPEQIMWHVHRRARLAAFLAEPEPEATNGVRA